MEEKKGRKEMLSTVYRKERSASGLALDVLNSGLQKAVRWGLANEAAWCVRQMADFFDAERGVYVGGKNGKGEDYDLVRAKACVTRFVHRLMVIFLEDCAEPCTWILVHRWLINDLLDRRRAETLTKDEFVRCATLATTLMCNVRHGRLYSFLRRCGEVASTTSVGAASVELISLLPAELRDCVPLTLETANKPSEFAAVPGVDVARWFREVAGREKFLVVCAASLQNVLLDKFLPNTFGTLDQRVERFCSRWQDHAAWAVTNYDRVPSHFAHPGVLDKHTAAGRAKGAMVAGARFTLLGSTCVRDFWATTLHPTVVRSYVTARLERDYREACSSGGDDTSGALIGSFDALMQRATLLGLMHEVFSPCPDAPNFNSDVLRRESSLFHLETRAQLNVSANGPDTYFANCFGFRVFVKGPYAFGASPFKSMIDAHQLKSRLAHLSSVCPYRFVLVADQFSPDNTLSTTGTTTVHGSRTKLQKTPSVFVVTRSLIPDSVWPLPTKRRESKVWPSTTVLDGDALIDNGVLMAPRFPEDFHPNHAAMVNYVFACLWRFVARVNDNSTRNIIAFTDSPLVYSIDEQNVLQWHADPSPFKFASSVLAELQKFTAEHWETTFLPVLSQQWMPVFTQHCPRGIANLQAMIDDRASSVFSSVTRKRARDE
jgi:hypothetical protein